MTHGRIPQLHNYIRRNLEKRATSTTLKVVIDKLIWPASLFGIIITLPQVWNIWYLHETIGVSVISWSGYIITTTIWILYGSVYKLKPVIVTNIIWLFLEILIVAGVLIY